MRLRRLDLSRYGIFTDHEIDFGAPSPGAPDLHVIYGPNEAGKSTALSGFLDLLFAFEHRSRYGFAHGYDAMRVEADLEIGSETRRFARIKRRQGSLLDRSGQPVSEGVLANALGGMNRETYQAMFSLDDDTLEAGGEAILRSEGDLGELLFSAGAGLVELREILDRLRQDAEGFHKKRAQNTRLRALMNRLRELGEKRKELDIAASAYARLTEEHNRAKEAYDEATATRAKMETERDNAERCLQGLLQLTEIRRLCEELEGLRTLPEPPQVWSERIGELVEWEPRLTTRIESLRERKRQSMEKREALVVDEAILAVEDRVTGLDLPRGRYVTAEVDLPRRRSELAEIEGRIAAAVKRLDKPSGADPNTLVIPAAVAGELRELAERRSEIEARRKAAVAEVKTAEAHIERAGRALEEANNENSDPAAFDRLNDALKATYSDNCRARLDLHAKELERLRVECDTELAQLRPWSGGTEELAHVGTPEADELERWQQDLDKAAGNIERIEQEKNRLTAERSRYTDLIGAKNAETGAVDDREAARLRADRETAWTLLRERLDAESADTFEKRLREDDAATAGRIAYAETLAAVRQAAEELRNTEAETERNAADLASACDRERRALDEVAAAVQTMIDTGAADLPPDITLPKLSGWIGRRAAVLKILYGMRRETVAFEHARDDIERHRGQLAEALTAADVTYDPAAELERLIQVAESAAAGDRDRRILSKAAREGLERAQADLERRQRDAAATERDNVAWRADWTGALSRCWLGQLEPEPSSAAVRRNLEEISNLESGIENRKNMAKRIENMQQDQDAYATEVRVLAESSDTAFDPDRAVAVGDELKARLDTALAHRELRSELSEEIEGVGKEIATIENELAELRAIADEMFQAFGVHTLREVDERLRKTTRRNELREELADREAELAASMKTDSPEEAKAILREADRETLERQVAEVKSRLDDASQRTNELYRELGKAEDALRAVGSDDAAARLETERRTVLLQIEEGARGHLRLLLGVAAAERALAAYLNKHRSSMMERASAAFRTISRGAYSGLESQLTDKGEILIGIVAGGGAKIASEMSKGARFQLYLALRVAGYREFANRHGPVPFIADDILETFDDFRAEETFRLFADMAGFGQVIYLSHHRHLCGIAKEVCPSVAIHELPTAAPGRP